jgi:hypothetical protein
LQKYGIYPNTFAKTIIKTHQKNPDVYFNTHLNNQFNIPPFSMDLKAGYQKYWSNIITPLDNEKYKTFFTMFYNKNIVLTGKENSLILEQKNKLFYSLSNENYEIFLVEWIKSCSLINDPYCMPPLKILSNFSTINFTKEAHETYTNANTKIYNLNNFLKTQNLENKNNLEIIRWWEKMNDGLGNNI